MIFNWISIRCRWIAAGLIDTKEPVTLEAYRIKLEVFSAETVTLMGRQLIEHYLLLSQEDLHLWETNPEEFGILSFDYFNSFPQFYAKKKTFKSIHLIFSYSFELIQLVLFSHRRRRWSLEIQPQGIKTHFIKCNWILNSILYDFFTLALHRVLISEPFPRVSDDFNSDALVDAERIDGSDSAQRHEQHHQEGCPLQRHRSRRIRTLWRSRLWQMVQPGSICIQLTPLTNNNHYKVHKSLIFHYCKVYFQLELIFFYIKN